MNKNELRRLYKRYKAKIVKEEELTKEQKILLQRYYGVESSMSSNK